MENHSGGRVWGRSPFSQKIKRKAKNKISRWCPKKTSHGGTAIAQVNGGGGGRGKKAEERMHLSIFDKIACGIRLTPST